MIHLPVNDHETGEQHDQISAHNHWPRPQPAQASRLLCASWSSATLVDLKGYMQRPVDAQLFV